MPESIPDLAGAAGAIDLARSVIDGAAHHLARQGRAATDIHQVIAYDLAHSAAAVETARAAIEYGERGLAEASLAAAFAAEVVWELASRLLGRESQWGAEHNALAGATAFLSAHRDPEWLASLAGTAGPRHLDPD